MEVCVCFCYNKKRITIQKYQNSNTIKTREGKNMETMQGKKNIVLIGMPGAGKSTVGVVLAKRLGYRFMDSDLVIQEQTKKLLHELITEHGDVYKRQGYHMEKAVYRTCREREGAGIKYYRRADR